MIIRGRDYKLKGTEIKVKVVGVSEGDIIIKYLGLSNQYKTVKPEQLEPI